MWRRPRAAGAPGLQAREDTFDEGAPGTRSPADLRKEEGTMATEPTSDADEASTDIGWRTYKCPVCSHTDGVLMAGAREVLIRCSHCDTPLEVSGKGERAGGGGHRGREPAPWAAGARLSPSRSTPVASPVTPRAPRAPGPSPGALSRCPHPRA